MLHPEASLQPLSLLRGFMALPSEQHRAGITNWIDGIRTRHRVEIPEIAKRARVSSSTIYRWFDEGHPFNASMTSLKKIAEAFETGLPLTEEAEKSKSEEGDVHEAETEISALETSGQNQKLWKIDTRALELAGYLPGDYILSDKDVAPRAGDVVMAEVFNFDRGSTDIRLRVYEAPFLTTKTMHPRTVDRPLFVDNERVHIMATVVKSLRLRA